MTVKELDAILEETGFPCVYGAFVEPQKPPYMEYSHLFTSNSFAEDSVDIVVDHWQINLYTNGKKSAEEKKLESALNNHGICWNKTSGNFDAKERVLQTIYEFSEVE